MVEIFGSSNCEFMQIKSSKLQNVDCPVVYYFCPAIIAVFKMVCYA